jgi:hypothetical protein
MTIEIQAARFTIIVNGTHAGKRWRWNDPGWLPRTRYFQAGRLFFSIHPDSFEGLK